MKSRALLVGLLALAASSACIPGEMGDVYTFALDWATSENPGLRGAAVVAEEVALEELARESYAHGIDTIDAFSFDEASSLRPADPRYPVYAAVVHSANGDPEEAIRANQRAVDALKVLHPDATESDIQRMFTEMRLEATRDLIVNGGTDRLDEALLAGYCFLLIDGYPAHFGGSVDGALYLATADYSLCQ